MSGEGIVRRCCECSFVMYEQEPYIVTDYGYAHPTCVREVR
jgi:hypothetical protein